MTGRVTLTGADGHCTDITQRDWAMAWPLTGETKRIYTQQGSDSVAWRPLPMGQ